MFMRTFLALVLLGLAADGSAQARDRAVVIEEAPILLSPDGERTPLRRASKGTDLVLIVDEGKWLKIEFQDPQFGVRTGYIESRWVTIFRGGARLPDAPAGASSRQGVPSASHADRAARDELRRFR